MSDSNLSLLNQNEIDILVRFLVDKKNSVDSSVLNQESIDKLIHLIRNNELRRLNPDSQDISPDLAAANLLKLNLQEQPGQLCELTFKSNQDTGYLEFYAVNPVTGKEQKITPAVYEKITLAEDDSEWGYSVAPCLFDKIAARFALKYSRETYSELCKHYALKNYGSEESSIPTVFLPSLSIIKKHLI